MLFKDVITLIDVRIIHDGPFPKEEESARWTYANKKSITRAEFSVAESAGNRAKSTAIRAVYMFEVREDEYSGEEWLEYEGNRYYIYRTYERGSVIELYCSDAKAGD